MSRTSMGTDIVLHEFHPPRDLRRFVCPPDSMLRLDEDVMVAEFAVGSLLQRHHLWADRWFTVTTTTDRVGAFVEPENFKTIPFAIMCDISTPFTRDGGAVSTVDLFLDVIVRADGTTYEVIDREDFAEARASGWLSDLEAEGAERGLADLLALVAADGLIDLLRAAHPFGPALRPAPHRLAPIDPTGFPHLLPGQRPTW